MNYEYYKKLRLAAVIVASVATAVMAAMEVADTILVVIQFNSIQFNSSHAPADGWYDGLEVSKLCFPN